MKRRKSKKHIKYIPPTEILCLLLGIAALILWYAYISYPPQPISNGDFENGFSSWDMLGDPNNCAEDTQCPTTWCNLRNDSCKVSAMFINLTNDTVFGKSAALLGHYAKDPRTESYSKLDLRQPIYIPDDNSHLSFYMKIEDGNPNGAYAYFLILSDNGSERTLWNLYGKFGDHSTSLYRNWTKMKFNLKGYKGRNVTLIFRFMQISRWTIIWTENALWYTDEVKITPRTVFVPQGNLLLYDNFSGTKLNEDNWGYFSVVGGVTVNDSMELYEAPFRVVNNYGSNRGVTIYSERNDLDNGTLKFDYSGIENADSNGALASIVVNFNQNNQAYAGYMPGAWAPDTGYRFRISTIKDIIILEVYNASQMIETKEINGSIHFQNHGHIKIIKRGQEFEIYYNGTNVGNITTTKILPPNRIGFSAGTFDSYRITINNVSFYKI